MMAEGPTPRQAPASRSAYAPHGSSTSQPASRLDAALVARGLVSSRERAKGAIAAGLVFVNGRLASKPSAPVGTCDEIEVRGVVLPYVSRGGLKLEKALAAFGIDVAGARCVDLGASTGGFTDCLLQHGAACVVAVDVGHDQLAAALRSDGRVTCLEGTDARAVTPEQVGGLLDVAVTDVSFISLAKVLPTMASLLREGGRAVCLIKPQFEAGREHVGKRGVVRDPHVHQAVIERVLGEARTCGLEPVGLDYSPITGPEGNIEYLLHAVRTGVAGVPGDQDRPGAADEVSVPKAPAHPVCPRSGAAGEGRTDEGETGAGAGIALRPPLDVAAVVRAAHAGLGR